MASLTPGAVSLAGFTLAHAVWDVSDAEPDEFLAPVGMLELQGQRRLVRFESGSSEDAVARAEAEMREASADADAWAFAREAAWRPSGPAGELQDVVVVEFWGEGMDAPAAVLQPFERGAPGRPFRLTDPPTLAVGGNPVSATDAEPALRVLERGFQSHDVAAKFWPTRPTGESGGAGGDA